MDLQYYQKSMASKAFFRRIAKSKLRHCLFPLLRPHRSAAVLGCGFEHRPGAPLQPTSTSPPMMETREDAPRYILPS
jgi:hypothetical protein